MGPFSSRCVAAACLLALVLRPGAANAAPTTCIELPPAPTWSQDICDETERTCRSEWLVAQWQFKKGASITLSDRSVSDGYKPFARCAAGCRVESTLKRPLTSTPRTQNWCHQNLQWTAPFLTSPPTAIAVACVWKVRGIQHERGRLADHANCYHPQLRPPRQLRHPGVEEDECWRANLDVHR